MYHATYRTTPTQYDVGLYKETSQANVITPQAGFQIFKFQIT